MKIIILDRATTSEKLEETPDFYRVVSISNKRPTQLNKIKIDGAKDILRLYFDDITQEWQKALFTEYHLATIEDCQQALDFLSQGGDCLIHCNAGISRSTAITLGHLLTLTQYSNYQQAIDYIYSIRPIASPNKYILELMCSILGRENEYEEMCEYIDNKRDSGGRAKIADNILSQLKKLDES